MPDPLPSDAGCPDTPPVAESAEAASSTQRIWRRCRHVAKRVVHSLLLLIGLYLLIVLVGLIPVNNDFVSTPDGIEIFIVSNPVHADLVLPLESTTVNWRDHFPAHCFAGDTVAETCVAIGWGDRGFFLATPTWGDLTVSTAANALLWPSETCMHVKMTSPHRLGGDAKSVRISESQYHALVDYINATFRHDSHEGKIVIPDFHYGDRDAFFEAHGRYHALDTCNCWVGGGLKAAGVRTGCLTPLPKTVTWWLPRETP